MFQLASKTRQKVYSFFKCQEDDSKLKVRHNRMHVLRMLTIRLEVCLAGHGGQIADASDR